MAAVAQGVAVRFARFEALEAYRLDILGSLVGIGIFAAMAFLLAPPFVWALLMAAAFLFLLGEHRRAIQWVALLGLVFMFAYDTQVEDARWSAYSRLRVEVTGEAAGRPVYLISANGVGHQVAMDVVERRRFEPLYYAPYEHAGTDRAR